MPRTGNTLLSSILNQNPQVYSSPLSPLVEYLWVIYDALERERSKLRPDQLLGSSNALKKFVDNYYEHIDKPIIFDRQKSWTLPNNLKILREFVNPNPKIIFTVRPIIEILTSFIVALPKETLRNHLFLEKFKIDDSKSIEDNYCDFLMMPNGKMERYEICFMEAIQEHNKDTVHIVEYDSIVNDPKQTLENIYKFLNLEEYTHNFNNILKLEEDYDEAHGYPKGWHEVRPKIEKVSVKPEDVLSPYILDKYSGKDYWRLK